MRSIYMDPMTPGQRLRATYNFQPVDHLIRTEFYIWEEAIAKWKDQGLPDDWAQTNLFNYEPTGYFPTGVNLGWCEPPFLPYFEPKIIESTEDYEIIQDGAGRHRHSQGRAWFGTGKPHRRSGVRGHRIEGFPSDSRQPRYHYGMLSKRRCAGG